MNPLEQPFRDLLAQVKLTHPVSPSGVAQDCGMCIAILEAEKALAGEVGSTPVTRQPFVTRLCFACDAVLPDDWETNLCAKCQL